MHPWLPLAVFALVAWSAQRLLSKVALTSLGTPKFYLLSAVVSLVTYTPYLLFRPPSLGQLGPAFGLGCLMAITFGVTTVAIRRGPLGAVSSLTALSPAFNCSAGGHDPERATRFGRLPGYCTSADRRGSAQRGIAPRRRKSRMVLVGHQLPRAAGYRSLHCQAGRNAGRSVGPPSDGCDGPGRCWTVPRPALALAAK